MVLMDLCVLVPAIAVQMCLNQFAATELLISLHVELDALWKRKM